MRCTQCAAVSYSAAARTMVAEGYRCPVCGGEVVLVPHEPPVAVASSGERTSASAAAVEREPARRFERE